MSDEPAPTHTLTTADGRILAWAEYGDPAGPPLFLFHGTPGSRFDRDPWARPLAARLIVPDRPGYGRSSPQPGRRITDWPADVAAIADHLGIERFAVAGISGGGPYSLACAALLPERVTRAGVICGVAQLDWDGANDGMLESNIALNEAARDQPEVLLAMGDGMAAAIQADVDGFLAQMRDLPEPDLLVMAEPEVRAAMRASLLEATRQGGAAFADDEILFAHPWGFDPATITVPVRLWQGALDRNVPVGHAHHLAEMIPGAQLTILPDEAHVSLAFRHAATFAAELVG